MTLSESMDTLRRELAALREAIEQSGASQRDLYSAEEVAQRLSISLSTVRVLIARGELRYLRIGNLVRVPRSSIDRFCRRNHYQVWGAKDPGTGRTRRPARMRAPAGEPASAPERGRAWRAAPRRGTGSGSGNAMGDGHDRSAPFPETDPSYHRRTTSEIKMSAGNTAGAPAEPVATGK